MVTISAEIGTSGRTETIETTDDARADISRAIEHEHPCTDLDTCDIGRALDDGFPLWAAHVLQGATETPLLDAVIGHHCEHGLDFGDAAETERREWLGSSTWTDARQCDACGGVTFDAPDTCGHCGASFDPEPDHESDAFISDAGQLGAMTSASLGGKHLGTFGGDDETTGEEKALAAIRAAMERDGFYPNVWRISDHGNISPLSLDD